jgi:hypothetical protein
VTGAEFSGVDFDLLADYVGGALDGTPDEATVAALVADDAVWQVAHGELVEAMAAVGVELTALGATPEPMPADLAVRLEVAFTSAVADPTPIDPELAAPAVPHVVPSSAGAAPERHLSAVPEDDDVDRGTGERKRVTAADRRRRWRWVSPIAAAAGVIAFVGVGIGYLTDRNTSSENSADRSASAPMLASVPAGGLAAEGKILASGTDYQLGTLTQPAAQASSTADAKVEAAPRPTPPDSIRSLSGQLPVDGALQACLDAIARENGGGSIEVQSVDYARFAGEPALVVRFSAAGTQWAWASGPDCGTPGAGAAKLAAVKVG